MESSTIFRWDDYLILTLLLIGTILIAVLFGCCRGKAKTLHEYLLGNRSLGVLPVGLSLVASHISGSELVGVPAEVYTGGTLYVLAVPALLLSCFVVSKVFIPVFCNLGIGSAYEYLEMRFSRSVRIFASVLYLITSISLLIPTLYIPAFYLNQVAGLNLNFVTFMMAFFGMFCANGGLKIIVWTNSFQIITQIVAFFSIIIVGTYKAGGLEYVLRTGYEGDQFNILKMELNPFQTNTFWTVLVGSFFTWCSALVASQESVQRYISVPSATEAKRALSIYWTANTVVTTMSIYSGLLVYAVYLECDPIERKLANASDQIYTHYIFDKIGNVPILPGIFIAGIFSAGLSTLSTGLNAMALTLHEDYVKSENVTDSMAGLITKSIVIGIGCFAVIMVFVVEKLGDNIAVCFAVAGVTTAPMLGMFFMGMVFPFVNHKGAMAGGVVSLVTVAWIGVGAYVNGTNDGDRSFANIGMRTIINGTFDYLVASDDMTSYGDVEVFFVYKLSHLMYKPVGICIALIVGTAVSYITGPLDPSTIDPNLICPQTRRFLLARREKETKVLNKLIDNCPADA